MSGESKKSLAEGRLDAPGAAAADPARDLLGELPRGVGQRGPGRRAAQFVDKLANAYGMLPGDYRAALLFHGLREHQEAGGDVPGHFEGRVKALSKAWGCKKVEAAKFLQGELDELMPYVHQKQPQAHDVDVRSIVFQVHGGTGQAAPGGRDLRPADVRNSPIKTVEHAPRSDADGRTSAPTPLKGNEE